MPSTSWQVVKKGPGMTLPVLCTSLHYTRNVIFFSLFGHYCLLLLLSLLSVCYLTIFHVSDSLSGCLLYSVIRSFYLYQELIGRLSIFFCLSVSSSSLSLSLYSVIPLKQSSHSTAISPPWKTHTHTRPRPDRGPWPRVNPGQAHDSGWPPRWPYRAPRSPPPLASSR